jgi:hypothetical protein
MNGKGLLRAGHQVTMLAEVPNHPEGIIRPSTGANSGARAARWYDVIRVWVRQHPKTFKTRMAFYLYQMQNAELAGYCWRVDFYDAIYATSPPLFVAQLHGSEPATSFHRLRSA